MRTIVRILLRALALAALASLPARAVTGSTDYSGLWYNASESGWGMNVIQQEQILFITLFIYGANSQPTWFVASGASFTSANSAGDRTYTGPLYATTGTPFSTTPFNPGSVTVAQVGTITFVGGADGTATVSYTANSSTVNKAVVRQTWAQPNFTLNTATAYAGANSGSITGCAVASNNGSTNGTYTSIALYINGSTMRVELTTPPTDAGLCTFQGGQLRPGRPLREGNPHRHLRRVSRVHAAHADCGAGDRGRGQPFHVPVHAHRRPGLCGVHRDRSVRRREEVAGAWAGGKAAACPPAVVGNV